MLLIAVARRLAAFAEAHEGSVAARPGGDEFLLAMADVPSRDAAPERAQALLEQIRAASAIDEHMVTVDASIGIAVLECAA
jgi:GGDEF domain-containing protein